MKETGPQRSDVRAGGEDAQWHERILCHPVLDREEQGHDYYAEDNEADNGGRGPGVGDAAEFKPNQKHDGSADNGERAEPVDGLKALEDGRAGGVHVQEEGQEKEGCTVAWD